MEKLEIKSFRDLAMPNYLHGDDLRGGEILATIEGFYKEELYERSSKGKVPKGIIKFKECKPVIINSVKATELNVIFPENKYTPEKIIGQKIIIYTVKEKHFGVEGPVLHFKKAVEKAKPVLDQKSKQWDKAIKSLEDGTVTIDQILPHYQVSDADIEILKNKSKK
jgi:hypothetical protein